jgi:hypothetical protein
MLLAMSACAGDLAPDEEDGDTGGGDGEASGLGGDGEASGLGGDGKLVAMGEGLPPCRACAVLMCLSTWRLVFGE